MYNPLMTPQDYARIMEYAGYVDVERCSGRTTAIALRAIADALANPGLPVEIKDHVDKQVCHDAVVKLVSCMIAQLQLLEMRVHTGDRTVCFGNPAYANSRA